MSGIASASGAASPDHSTSVVDGISRTGLTFQITATTTAQYLATAWAANTAYVAGQVVVNQRRVYRCTTSGTSAATGNGPLATGADIADGTVAWRGVAPFVNGFKITNVDSAIKVYWTIGEVATATIGDVIMASGGVALTVDDPSLISVIAASSTAVLTVAGLS